MTTWTALSFTVRGIYVSARSLSWRFRSVRAFRRWMYVGMRACAFRRSFMCVVDARRGWRRDFAYPCPWTTSSFVFQREPFLLLARALLRRIQARALHTILIVCPWGVVESLRFGWLLYTWGGVRQEFGEARGALAERGLEITCREEAGTPTSNSNGRHSP